MPQAGLPAFAADLARSLDVLGGIRVDIPT